MVSMQKAGLIIKVLGCSTNFVPTCVTRQWLRYTPSMLGLRQMPVTYTMSNSYHTSLVLRSRRRDVVAPPPPPAPAKEKKNVLLLDEDGGEIGQMGWHAANKIATEKDLKMLQISMDSDSQQVFQLMTGKALMEEQKKMRAEKKGKHKVSKMIVNSTITDHDLEIKIHHIAQWLEKDHEVKVTVKNQSRDSKVSGLKCAIMKCEIY